MPTPSPAVLKAAAQDLRHYARQQRSHATSCDSLLDSISKLSNDQTWTGTYPTSVNAQIAGWAKSLTATAEGMRSDATNWESVATTFETEAGKAHPGG